MYRVVSGMISDLIGGHISIGFDYTAPAITQVQAGRLRALAIAGPKRLPMLPDVPTAKESGLPNFESQAWTGMFLPAGTPAEIVKEIHDEIVKALQQESIRESAAREGTELIGDSPEDFAAFIQSETAKWGKVVRVAGVKAD